MRTAEFEQWMKRAKLAPGTIDSRLANCRWIEENVGCDLDDAYNDNGGKIVYDALEYHQGVRHPLEYLIDGDPYTNLSMYRSAANLYFEFCSGVEHVKRKTARRGKSSAVKISYMDGYGPNGKTTASPKSSIEAKAEPVANFGEISSMWREFMAATNRITAALGRSANIVGEFAERITAEYYGGELLTASHKSADIRLLDGCLIQVKSRVPRQTATTSLSPIRSWDFDLLVVILFNEDGSIFKALEMDVDVARSHARRDSHQNSDLLVTTEEFLRDPRAKDITVALSSLVDSRGGR